MCYMLSFCRRSMDKAGIFVDRQFVFVKYIAQISNFGIKCGIIQCIATHNFLLLKFYGWLQKPSGLIKYILMHVCWISGRNLMQLSLVTLQNCRIHCKTFLWNFGFQESILSKMGNRVKFSHFNWIGKHRDKEWIESACNKKDLNCLNPKNYLYVTQWRTKVNNNKFNKGFVRLNLHFFCNCV